MVTLIETPRLSGMLRTFLTEHGQEFDLEREFLERTKRIKELKRTAPSLWAHKLGGADEDGGDRFDWASFSAGRDQSTRRAQIVKETFNKFYNLINKLLGSEHSSSIVGAFAKAVYDVIVKTSDMNPSDPRRRKEVAKALSLTSVDNTSYDNLINWCTELSQWKKAKSELETELDTTTDNKTSSNEYGADIPFTYPTGEWLRIVDLDVQAAKARTSAPTSTTVSSESTSKSTKASHPPTTQEVLHPSRPTNAGKESGRYDYAWLKTLCVQYCQRTHSPIPPENLMTSLHSILTSKKSDDELQGDLFEFLGGDFDFIQALLSNRQNYLSQQGVPTRASSAPSFVQPAAKTAAVGASVTINLAEDKEFEKQRRKEEKRLRKQRVAFGKGEEEDLMDSRLLRTAYSNSQSSVPEQEFFFDVDEGSEFGGGLGGGTATTSGLSRVKMILPEGTIRENKKEYEQVTVPYQVPPPMSTNERLVPISELDSWAQTAFKGYKSLNRIQSRLYDSAYKSNENLLVCAPTGAGKTNIALLTMLHEIGQHFRGTILLKDDFKIIYVAPMKALAAEMVENFSKRLAPLGIVVRELTGDMQLTKKELNETQIIVTTPEKWDVVTRKSADVALTQMVRLLIIDEVHLLHEDRGPVIETLIARTIRQVEATQMMIRIVGLSATLPNYQDVALFLRVDPLRGLFHFDNAYRPVPLTQTFIGAKETNPMKRLDQMSRICFEKLKDARVEGHQVMIFVHARKDTVKTAEKMAELALEDNCLQLFEYNPETSQEATKLEHAKSEVSRSRNKELRALFEQGFGIHHAGMLRSDRNLVEKLFGAGLINVLVCTATLAWGVNLPAHTVIIKGTQIYDAKHGSFIELSMLDVMQIFGRAGRPQFDTSGEGFIITSHDQLARYLSLLNAQMPIESQFENNLPDNLNAEIILGTVANVKEAITWLSYTYLFIRMRRNPMVYGISYEESRLDPTLEQKRRHLIIEAARRLSECQMISFDEASGTFHPTDVGRLASHYYINHDTIERFNDLLKPNVKEGELFDIFAQASEFENIRLREEEMEELHRLEEEACAYPVKGGPENQNGKINILLQAYLSQAHIENFALVSDSTYISTNAARLFRGLFEFSLKKGWPLVSHKLLTICKMVDRRLWDDYHPLRQFPNPPVQLLDKLERHEATIEKLVDMTPTEIGHLLNNPRGGAIISKMVKQFPKLELSASIQPITRTVLRVHLTISADFSWKDKIHGTVEPWWIWVEDNENDHIYHSEYFLLHKKNKDEPQELIFTIPVFEPLPPQYYIRVISERWLGAEVELALSFKHLILPELHIPHTELLNLEPLPVTALHNASYQKLYPFSHFNPIQTQVFHTLVHTDHNVLLGAPTGSGKTITAELGMFRIFNNYPNLKVVYIAPLKALVRERMRDWNEKFVKKLGKSMVELTGDHTPDVRALKSAHIVTTTPEKWDGISRSWQQRSYVRKVGLLIIDEIHLLGEERGPILEVIVSRMRYISSHTDTPIRIIGLSTAMANAKDLADWLGIEGPGLFNFRPSVRPVPLEVHISGFSGKHYCPRMATMNKPAYSAIIQHSPMKPVLVFVSSRRQTRLTAIDLISYCATEENPRRFLHMSDAELTKVLSRILDQNLKHALSFGIGLHHAGLSPGDREIVEELFAKVKIQILISTSTLAWGVNLPAHLVIIKGTEFYDGKTKRYIDMPVTDILQMMGRAGRPQFDNHAKACIFVHEPKKNFYKKFLYEPFPVESHLHKYLHDHINAEIVAGTIKTKQDAIDYLTWTYLFRRIMVNPTYYSLEDSSFESISQYLSELIDDTLSDLEMAGCISIDEDSADFTQEETGLAALVPKTLGRIASFYYLHFKTMRLFSEYIAENNTLESLLQILCNTTEYEELPVRHNEDKVNAELAARVPWGVDNRSMDDPHVKANLLLQAHFSRVELPISDYETDTKSVLDQAVRILQAIVDVAAEGGWLFTTLNAMHLMQTIIQGRWFTDSTLSTLPVLDNEMIDKLRERGVDSIPEITVMNREEIRFFLVERGKSTRKIKEFYSALNKIPLVNLDLKHPSQVSLQKKMKNNKAKKSKKEAEDEDEEEEDIQVTVEVTLSRVNNSQPTDVYAPLFPKNLDESWWLLVGDPITGELLALKRTTFNRTLTTSLSFSAPEIEGERTYALYFMSANYLGIDQQYFFTVDFTSN